MVQKQGRNEYKWEGAEGIDPVLRASGRAIKEGRGQCTGGFRGRREEAEGSALELPEGYQQRSPG